MEWHIDDVLYEPEQIEVVLTLENDSDCCTMWKPHDLPITDGNSNERVERQSYGIQSVQTTPNSALILKAGGVEHKVSPLKAIGTKRTIVKMAFVRKNATMKAGMEEHASSAVVGGSRKGRDRTRKGSDATKKGSRSRKKR